MCDLRKWKMLEGQLNPEWHDEPPDPDELDDLASQLYDEYEAGERSLSSTVAAYRRAVEGRL